jgi:hypothetical protein
VRGGILWQTGRAGCHAGVASGSRATSEAGHDTDSNFQSPWQTRAERRDSAPGREPAHIFSTSVGFLPRLYFGSRYNLPMWEWLILSLALGLSAALGRHGV